MAEALGGTPPAPFWVPRGIRMVRIDGDTGRLPGPTTERVILEAFKPGTEPKAGVPLAGGAVSGAPTPGSIPAADRGLY